MRGEQMRVRRHMSWCVWGGCVCLCRYMLDVIRVRVRRWCVR